MSGRHRSTFDRIERDVYLADRTALDVKAARRGPKRLAKRLGRRWLTREFFRMLRR